MLYGGVVPALTATLSGFVNGDTASIMSGRASLRARREPATAPWARTRSRSWPVLLSSANYSFPNLVNGTLAIGKAHLTVTADDKSMLYGGMVRHQRLPSAGRQRRHHQRRGRDARRLTTTATSSGAITHAQ